MRVSISQDRDFGHFCACSFTYMLFNLVLKLLNTPACKLIPLFLLCNNSERIVASLRLKNERGERLSSHRSDHVTGVWGGLHNLCKVQRIFLHLGFQQVQLCSQPSYPFIPIVIMHFYSICKFFFSFRTNF